MIGIDEIEFIPVKKVLPKRHQFRTNGFSSATTSAIKQFTEETFPIIIKEKKSKEEAIPFEK